MLPVNTANVSFISIELEDKSTQAEVEIPEQLIQEYKELNEKLDRTITKINNKRKKINLKK